jgi:hypothetical protein
MGTVFEVFIFIPSSINNAELREWLQPSRRNKRTRISRNSVHGRSRAKRVSMRL